MRKGGKKQLSKKQSAIVFLLFGTYIASLGYFFPEKALVPIWTLYSLAGIFFTGALGYVVPKHARILIIILANLFIIVSLIGIGFYGTGGCSVSGGGITTTHGTNSGICALPGYIGIIWAIGFVVYLIKKIVKMFTKK